MIFAESAARFFGPASECADELRTHLQGRQHILFESDRQTRIHLDLQIYAETSLPALGDNYICALGGMKFEPIARLRPSMILT